MLLLLDRSVATSALLRSATRLIAQLLAPDLPPLHNLEPYLLACRDDRIGGFGKTPDDEADLYHTHFALSALALAREGGGFDAALDVSTAAVKWVREMVASN